MRRKLYLEVLLDSDDEEGKDMLKMIQYVAKAPTSFNLSKLIFLYGMRVLKFRATTPQTGKWAQKKDEKIPIPTFTIEVG